MSTSEFNSWLREWGYNVVDISEVPKIIVVGGPHHENKAEVASLLSVANPQYFLHEYADVRFHHLASGETKVFPGTPLNITDMSLIEQGINQYILDSAREAGCEQVVGCDLSEQEVNLAARELAEREQDRYHFDSTDGVGYHKNPSGGIDWNKDITRVDTCILPFRDRRIAGRSIEFAGKSDKSIVTVVGTRHMDQTSYIHGPLRESGLDYLTINQDTRVAALNA